MNYAPAQPLGVEKVRKRMPVSTMTDPAILMPAIWDSFKKLHPRHMIGNPVMFCVEIVAGLTTVLFLRDLFTGGGHLLFALQINIWLWFTVVFANFAEAVAEGRGKAQAASLRKTKTETSAKLMVEGLREWKNVAATTLKPGDVVLVEAND